MRMSRREKGKHYQKVNLHGSGGAVVVIQFCVLLAHPTANTILVVTTYDKQPRNTQITQMTDYAMGLTFAFYSHQPYVYGGKWVLCSSVVHIVCCRFFFVNSFFFSVKTWYNVTIGVLSLKTKFHIRSHFNGSFDSIETWLAHAYTGAPPSPHTHTCTIESRNCLIFSSFHRWNIYFYPLFRALASYSSIFFFCIDYIDLMAVIFVFHKCIIAYVDV